MDETPRDSAPVPAAPPSLSKKPVAEGELRASDADRDRVADILREALAEGRLDPEEHAERIDGVYNAKTVGELEPLVRDLPVGRRAAGPAAAPPPPPYPEPQSQTLVAIFSGSARKGRWSVGRRTSAFALFGGVDIDLTEAVFHQQEILINATAVFGGVDIKVPENVSLRGSGTAIFGGFDVHAQEADDPRAPVVVVTGFALFGGVDAKGKKGKFLKNLTDRMRKHGLGH
ncbi:DUF1707 domain-containing protein [Streptomyces sp. WMMC500]|uniref:DUF1707 SHOCT-like domain-containing protein n=1 Tax=Streptomyces sp. WMMC500 TaxID=3015154 RepID=UPI00248BE953|nr:DUF1707 domain-containing protein [Streptomyces sp. WMMC500]WBB63431.1 DUF1707 domain-containing protein [Streptomyces sp. WMMC500]